MGLRKKNVPADHGALPHNTNDALARIIESNDEANNPIVNGSVDVTSTEYHRKKGESQQAYNERIPVALQPVAPAPTHTYLGEKV